MIIIILAFTCKCVFFLAVYCKLVPFNYVILTSSVKRFRDLLKIKCYIKVIMIIIIL